MEHKQTQPAVHIGILSYPGVLQSAIHGLSDMFHFANKICAEQPQIKFRGFTVSLWQVSRDAVDCTSEPVKTKKSFSAKLDAVIVPPAFEYQYYCEPDVFLQQWLQSMHRRGAIICSACAGSFILAETGLLEQHKATTHWNLTAEFYRRYPTVRLDTDRILVNEGDIITAGGLMSWIDLGLELIEQFSHPLIVQELGKLLIIDISKREQRYYKKFIPILNHGNEVILKAQHYIQKKYSGPISIKTLADHCHIGQRTLLRNFVKATGYTPIEYIQHIRIQKSRELIETTNKHVEQIASQVGYEDPSAFRKLFKKLTGLSPKEFRQRFRPVKKVSA